MNWRRRAFRAAALVAATGASVACLKTPPPAPWRVVVAYPSTLSSLHPAMSSDEFSYSIISNVFEPLVDIDGRQALRPGLASSWHSVDPQTWSFELRPGIVFHDGRPVDAAAVAASLERARTDTRLRMTNSLQAIDRFSASGAAMVEVRTRFPVPDLAARLADAGVWAEPGDAENPPAGSGPYRVERWSEGGEVILARLRGEGPDELVFRAIPDAGQRVAALHRGEVDLVAEVAAADVPAVREDRRLKLVESRGLRVLFLGMHCAAERLAEIPVSRNPFRDPRVRRAVALAIDRQALVDGPLGGFGEVLDQPLAPEVFGYASHLPAIGFDPEEARRLLGAAGFAHGFATPLDYVPGKYRDVEGVVEAIVADLGRVGIHVTPRPSSYPDYLERLDRHGSAFFLRGWSTSVSAGPSYDFLLHTPGGAYGGSNAGAYSNPGLDALLEGAGREPDDAKRLAQLQRAGEMIRADLPLVPLYRQFNLYAARADLLFDPRLDRAVRGVELRRLGR